MFNRLMSLRFLGGHSLALLIAFLIGTVAGVVTAPKSITAASLGQLLEGVVVFDQLHIHAQQRHASWPATPTTIRLHPAFVHGQF
jgi:hypothetical protein